jgi:hypothetical protein
MKLLIAVSIIALTLTTGFTCSKNTPVEPQVQAPAQQDPAATPSQEQMAQPAAPTEGAPAAEPTAPAEGEKK